MQITASLKFKKKDDLVPLKYFFKDNKNTEKQQLASQLGVLGNLSLNMLNFTSTTNPATTAPRKIA